MCACGKTDGENIAHINETIVLEEATEDKNGLAYDKCTVCGYNVAPYIIPATNHSHNYSDTWTYDNSGHWHECTCGDRSDEAYHIWEAGSQQNIPQQQVQVARREPVLFVISRK